ncbi:MAG: nucleotide exchange factor GrpE [Desulfobacterales bacterium]
MQELQKGYTLHDRLLRPAMVVVSKPKTDASADQTDEND